MKVLVVLGGDCENHTIQKAYKDFSDMVICADSGATHAVHAGIIPDLVVGDMDSIPVDTLNNLKNQNVQCDTFPRAKDEIDGELALKAAVKAAATSIGVVGFSGSRWDHMLAGLLHCVGLNIPVTVYLENETMYISEHHFEISTHSGDIISLVPLTLTCTDIHTEGLKYVLRGEALTFGSTRGVSNVATGSKIRVEYSSGTLCIIHTWKGE